jgi:hypothetical protein
MRILPLFWLAVLPFVIAVAPSDLARAPAAADCPAFADNTSRIANLQTGQAVTDGATTTLRFSSLVRGCGEWNSEARGSDCFDHWDFQISIPTEELVPGTYELGKIGAAFRDFFVKTTPEPGCTHECRTAAQGRGSVSLEASPAQLVVKSADDGCITGTIAGLRGPNFDDAPDYNGAFFAVRCAP